nr:PREDICTED: probable F-box protein At4g22165 [Musa acuminata subsp. malaccensis]
MGSTTILSRVEKSSYILGIPSSSNDGSFNFGGNEDAPFTNKKKGNDNDKETDSNQESSSNNGTNQKKIKCNRCELTKDVLGMIHDELSICDYVRFKAVCKHWNLVNKFEDQCRLRPQAPWLMFSGDDNSTAKFFSIVEKKIYKIQCPQPMIGKRIYVGSCHGWLVTLDGRCNMHLLNPLTGAQIRLPSVLTLPFIRDIYNLEGQITNFNVEQDNNHYSLWLKFIRKVVISKAPDADNDFTIMMIYSHWCKLAFARAGDKAWTPIISPYYYSDIIYRNAKFYTINYRQMIEVWEADELVFSIINLDLPPDVLLRGICYLVESLDEIWNKSPQTSKDSSHLLYKSPPISLMKREEPTEVIAFKRL